MNREQVINYKSSDKYLIKLVSSYYFDAFDHKYFQYILPMHYLVLNYNNV